MKRISRSERRDFAAKVLTLGQACPASFAKSAIANNTSNLPPRALLCFQTRESIATLIKMRVAPPRGALFASAAVAKIPRPAL